MSVETNAPPTEPTSDPVNSQGNESTTTAQADSAPPATSDPTPAAAQGPTRPPIPLWRRLIYLLLALFLGLGALELVAAGIERSALKTMRQLPTPAPRKMTGPMKAFREEILADRMRRGLPSLRPNIPIPLDNRPTTTSWQLLPNSRSSLYATNSDGLRGPEILPLIPGEIRVLTLGDSSIFGDSVDEDQVWSSVLAKQLGQTWGRPVRAINGAIPGHNTNQSLEILAAVGEKAQPTWVIIGNLWSDVYRNDQVHAQEQDVPRYRANVWLRGFALYRTLHILMSPWLESIRVGFMVDQADLGSIHAGGPAPRVGLKPYISNLLELVKRTQTLGARVAFLGLAAPVDLDSAPVPETIREYRNAMKSVAKRFNAPYVDGPEVMKAAGASIGYFTDHVHPAPEGHALLGQAMADALTLIGPPPAGTSQYPAAP